MANRTCSLEDCERDYLARGLCSKHYQRLRRSGDPFTVLPSQKPRPPKCADSSCGRLARYSDRLCTKHHYLATRPRCIDCGEPCSKGSDSGRCIDCYWEWRRSESPYTTMTRAEYDAQRYNSATRRNEALRQKYGISAEEYEQLWHDQGGRCAICGQSETEAMTTHARLVVDHDHNSNTIRGLLCDLCNKGLGQFRDDISRVRQALKYLEDHNGWMDSGMVDVAGNVSSD